MRYLYALKQRRSDTQIWEMSFTRKCYLCTSTRDYLSSRLQHFFPMARPYGEVTKRLQADINTKEANEDVGGRMGGPHASRATNERRQSARWNI